MKRQPRLSDFVKLFTLAVISSLLFAACGNGNGGDVLYYGALGYPRAVGVQQDPATGEDVETDEGYSDQIFAALQPNFPNLQLVKLGCPGETTATMINGGICNDYASGNQLNDALKFL